MIGSGNPVLSEKAYSVRPIGDDMVMTVNGTVNKTMMLLFALTVGALLAWMQPQIFARLTMPVALGAFVIAMVVIFKKTLAPTLAPIYAFLEGLVLGSITMMMEVTYPGIAFQAVGGTIAVFAAMLCIYRMKLIKVTRKFKIVVTGAIMGILGIYIVSFIMSLFGKTMAIHNPTPLGIIFSVIVCAVAAISFIIDFDNIEKGAEAGAPLYMEWYSAFGLMVTLIWLYIEILQLLAKLRGSDNR